MVLSADQKREYSDRKIAITWINREVKFMMIQRTNAWNRLKIAQEFTWVTQENE